MIDKNVYIMAAKYNMRTAVFIELSARGQWLDQLSNLQMVHT